MTDVKELAVKYWPWALGGTIGIWLISRMAANDSGGDGGTVQSAYNPDFMAMQIEGMRIGAASGDTRYIADVQREIGMGKLQVEMQSSINERDVAKYGIDAGVAMKFAELQGQQYIAELTTNAAIQQSIISGNTTIAVNEIGAGVKAMYAYADILEQLNVPTIAAIESTTAQNLKAIEAFTMLGVESYRIKGNIAGQAIDTSRAITEATGANLVSVTEVFGPSVYPLHIQNVERPNLDWLAQITGQITNAIVPG